MGQRNPYDLLGVAIDASQEDIRAAYIHRAKVLHPDRFDKSTQPSEWQMANEMLQELNDAYGQLNVGMGGTNADRNRQGPPDPRRKTQTFASPSNDIDLNKTISYWGQLSELYYRPQQIPIPVLDKKDFHPHLAALNQYVQANFQAEYGVSVLDRSGVDPLVLQAGALTRECLVNLSKIITERLTLISRAQYFKEKYPFWKTLWVGWQDMGISSEEHRRDAEECNSIDPRLIQLGESLSAAQNNFRMSLSGISLKLVAKYGDVFRVGEI